MTTDVRPRPRPALITARLLLAVLVLGSMVGPLHASASPSPGSEVEGVEAWLDAELPADAAPGTEIQVGATIWSTVHHGPIRGLVFFRLYPAAGDSAYVETQASEDWPGHHVVRLTVPDGGVGELHIGTQGTACDASGCTRSDALYAVAGVGPPPDAPLTAIAVVTIEPPRGAIRAEEAIDVRARLVPRVEWPSSAFALPAKLTFVLGEPRGPQVGTVDAPVEGSRGTYLARIPLPAPGDWVVQAATDDSGDPDSLFGTSTTRIIAEAPGTATPSPSLPPAAPPTSSDSMSPLLLAALIAVVGVGGLLLLGRRRGS